MNVIPAFRNITEAPEPWTDDICDLIRDRWQASIPRRLSASVARWATREEVKAGAKGAATTAARLKQRREAMVPIVLDMVSQGRNQKAIAEELRISRMTVRAIVREVAA